jgi:hypothetical protein
VSRKHFPASVQAYRRILAGRLSGPKKLFADRPSQTRLRREGRQAIGIEDGDNDGSNQSPAKKMKGPEYSSLLA